MRYYLRAKGLSDDLIEMGLQEIKEEQYKKVLISTLKEKAKTIKSGDKFEKMGQIIRFAQSRGFEPEIIHRYLSEVVKWAFYQFRHFPKYLKIDKVNFTNPNLFTFTHHN